MRGSTLQALAAAMAVLLPACSTFQASPLCGHPTCVRHLDLERAQAEIPLGAQARVIDMLGPVGRDWKVAFDQATASPVVFEEGFLIGWGHAFPVEQEELDDPNAPFRELKGLRGGEDSATVERRRGRADKVVRFRSVEGEEVQLWSWYRADLLLVLTRQLQWDGLEEAWQLEPELTLRGYGEGFGEYRANR
jgi:hypothetical protein